MALAVLGFLAVCALLAVSASAQTSTAATAQTPVTEPALTVATLSPSLSPNRLGAKGALTLAIQYSGGEMGVPSPLRRVAVRFPAGLHLDIPRLRACNLARLRANGASGCPKQSLIGTGHALAEVSVGVVPVTEHVSMYAFLGPPKNGAATIYILGQGYVPSDQRVVLTGTVRPSRAPYGEEMVVSVPPISTVPLEPDASLVAVSLSVGTFGRRHMRDANTVVAPSSCPAEGFPFAAEFTYANGSTGSTLIKTACPVTSRSAVTARTTSQKALAARTFSLNETGHLHLTSKHEFTLNEQGSASGTVPGTIYVHLTLVSTSQVSAEVNIYRRRLDLGPWNRELSRGHAQTADFSGPMSIGRGTGSLRRRARVRA